MTRSQYPNLLEPFRLRSVERDGNRLRAFHRNEYSDAEEIRVVDQVVVEHGTFPADEVYRDLAPLARNEKSCSASMR